VSKIPNLLGIFERLASSLSVILCLEEEKIRKRAYYLTCVKKKRFLVTKACGSDGSFLQTYYFCIVQRDKKDNKKG